LGGSDSEKAWLIYQKMKQAQVNSLLKSNHYGQLLVTLKYGDATVIPRMVSVLQDMKRDQVHEPNSHHLSQVLFAMCRQGKVEAACQLIQTCKPEQLTPSHYQTLVQSLHNRKNHHHKLTERVLHILLTAMKRSRVVLNAPTVTQMVSQLSKDDKVDHIVNFLKAFDKVNTHASNNSSNNHYNVHIYTALISGFAKQANCTSAKHLFDEMKRHGIRPNQVTYTALIEAYGKAGDFTSAIRILNRAKQTYNKLLPSMVTSLLINAVQHGHLDLANRTLARIKREIKLSEMDIKLKSALLWLKVHKDLNRARSFFDMLNEENNGSVDHIMVNKLVIGAGTLGSRSAVYDQFSLHGKLSPPDNVDTEMRANHHLSEALFKCRDVPAALGVFIQMRQISIPDDITLAMVIQGLVNNNEHNLAWRLFKTLRNDGLEPNLHAYSSILKALSRNDVSIHKAQSKVDPQMILDAGIRSSADASAVPNTTEALYLFRHMTGFHQPNVYIYTTLISCFAKQDLGRAVKVFSHMCSSEVRPTIETYTALLQGCAIFRNSNMALSVFNHMSEAHVTPNAATWRYLLKSLVRSKVAKKEVDKVGELARKALKKVEGL
jgi:pentatricopeptide repeat protein